MNLSSTPRRLLILAGAMLVILALGVASAAAATSLEEITRFGERGKQKSGTPVPEGKIAGDSPEEEQRYAIAVDPKEGNDVFVLDEAEKFSATETNKKTGEERYVTTRHLRIQKFDPATGEVLASRSFSVASPEENTEEEEGDLERESFDLAVDPTNGIVYLLTEEPRNYDLALDPEAPVATTLYAFKTKESGKELVPAEHANASTGVLDDATQLEAESETNGAALLEPRGITVEASTGDVVILGRIDEDGEGKAVVGYPTEEIAHPGDHFTLERVTDTGADAERYVDKKNFFKNARNEEEYPGSPVVTSAGKVLVRFGLEGITEIPSKFNEATAAGTEPTLVSSEPEHVVSIDEAGPENEYSAGGLSVSPEGTLYEPAVIRNEAAGESNNRYAAINLRASATGALVGWTGGQAEIVNEAHKFTPSYNCVLEPTAAGEALYVAAGANERVFVLAPEYLRESEGGFKLSNHDGIVEYGPSEGKKTRCPTASASPVAIYVNGEAIESSEPVVAGNSVELSEKVAQADALGITWRIENKATKAVQEVKTLEFPIVSEALQLQQPQLSYKFAAEDEYAVTAAVSTDDLATPEVTSASRAVKVLESVHVTTQPKSASVAEGATAVFTASASGYEPSLQWEVSTNNGTSWADTGTKNDATLTVERTTASENGYEYRAVFKDKIGTGEFKATSEVATLTVSGPPKAPAIEASSEPASRTVFEGESAAFTAKASGSPVPTVQWELSSNDGTSWSAISGATSTTYTVERATSSESGYEYRAKFTNSLGSTTSTAATLTVSPTATTGGGGGGGGGNGGGTNTTPGGEVLPIKVTVAPAVPKAVIAGTSITVSSSGVLSLKITCPTGETRCEGAVTLRTLTAVSARVATAHDAKAKRAILTLASGAFSVVGGGSETVKLHLSATARKLLARSHTLRAKATLVAHDPAGGKDTQLELVTLRLAKKR